MKKFLSLSFGGLCFLAAVSNAQMARLSLYFDLVEMSYTTFNAKRQAEPKWCKILTPPHGVGHLGKFMGFFGSLGVGTAVFEHNDFTQIESGSIHRADTIFTWSILRESFTSYFPIIIHYNPYSRRLGFGNLSIYGYLKYSSWISGEYSVEPEVRGEHYYEFTSPHYPHYFICQYMAYKCPSSYVDIGVSVSFNPLKFVPLWLRLGIQRLDYAYHIPESFKKAKVPVPSPVETRFYVSYGLSIGYWGIK